MHVPGRLWNNPLDETTVTQLIDWLDLDPEDTVLDVGCGNAEILARVVERSGARGVGVDPDPEEIVAATQRLVAVRDRVTLHESTFADAPLADATFDAAVCLGSTHAFGGPGTGYRATLTMLRDRLRPGGRLLVGEGYWRRTPDAAYLDATGIGAADFVSHEDNVAIGASLGYVPLAAVAASTRDWDLFESGSWRHAMLQSDANPGDADARALAEHRTGWRAAYLRWGRETLGFAGYLFLRPAE